MEAVDFYLSYSNCSRVTYESPENHMMGPKKSNHVLQREYQWEQTKRI